MDPPGASCARLGARGSRAAARGLVARAPSRLRPSKQASRLDGIAQPRHAVHPARGRARLPWQRRAVSRLEMVHYAPFIEGGRMLLRGVQSLLGTTAVVLGIASLAPGALAAD